MSFPLPSLPTLPPVVRQPWTATWWVSFLQGLGTAFPAPNAPDEDWQHFVLKCSTWPFVLLALGFIVAICVLCSSCCVKQSNRAGARAPRRCPSACAGVMALLLLAAGAMVYWETGSKALGTAQDELARAAGDTAKAVSEGNKMQDQGKAILSNLDSIPKGCPKAVRKHAEQLVKPVRQQVVDYTQSVAQFQTLMKPVPGQIKSVEDTGATVASVVGAALLAPLALVLLCCAAMVLIVAAPQCMRPCTGCCLGALAPLIMMPTVVVVTVAAAAQLDLGIVTSSFCKNVDSNSIAYIQSIEGSNSTTYELSLYYIQGKGKNPLLEQLQSADAELVQVGDTLNNFGDQVAAFCPEWKGLPDLKDGIKSAHVSLQSGFSLLSPQNIYPYYNKAVRQDLCQTMVIGLGWLVLFQASVGLVALPVLILLGTKYLKDLKRRQLDPLLGR